MIYSKHINELKWEDIVDFCNQQIAEGATLDYKKDFPNDLSKTIAAFANTMGGIILLGVAENDQNKPLLPISGIPFERGLSERVMNVILSNITPPVIPEIQPCENEDKSKTVIVIRIPQSNQTPHAINNNTRVYIRTGNRNKYEELISVDKLQWLLNNRNKSLLLREELLNKSNERFQKYFEKELNNKKIEEKKSIKDLSRLSLVLSPVFPSNILCTPPELKKILENIYVFDYFYTSDEFPIDNGRGTSISYQNGITLGLFVENYAYFTDLNCFGIYFYKQNLFKKFYDKGDLPNNIIRVNEIFSRMDQFFDSANLFYQQLRFHGLIKFDFSIDGLSKYKLIVGNDHYLSTMEEIVTSDYTCLSSELEIKKREIISSAVKNLGWTYNINITDDYLRSIKTK